MSYYNEEIAKAFKVLQFDQPTASLETVTKQYRALSLKFHPDKNPLNPKAEFEFKRVQAAFSFIKKCFGRIIQLTQMQAGY